MVSGNVVSSARVNGSKPSLSSSRATSTAKQSESKPESSNTRSSDNGARLLCCSSATFSISDIIVNFIVIAPHLCFRTPAGILARRSCSSSQRDYGQCSIPPRRTRAFWQNAMARLAAHATPGAPRYGYMLDDGSGPVGVVLLVSCTVPAGEGTCVRSKVSSWDVAGSYRCYDTRLLSQA